MTPAFRSHFLPGVLSPRGVATHDEGLTTLRLCAHTGVVRRRARVCSASLLSQAGFACSRTPAIFGPSQCPLAATPGSRAFLPVTPRFFTTISRDRLPKQVFLLTVPPDSRTYTVLTAPSLAACYGLQATPAACGLSRTSRPPTFQHRDPEFTKRTFPPLRCRRLPSSGPRHDLCGVVTLRPPRCAGYPRI